MEKELQDIANNLRRDSLMMTSSAGSGHPTSCLSCAEIFSVLFFNVMSYDSKNSKNPENDEFILSKGHSAPIYYSSLKRTGCISYDLLKYRDLTSPLEGHPTPLDGWIKVASGSLGQGLSVGAGMALAAKLQNKNYKTYVLLGDSELSEGQIYEASQIASHYKLNNLISIADINRLGQRGETMVGWNIQEYQKRFSSFGWKTIVIDGHNISQLILAFKQAKESILPTIILSKTIKGKGVSFLEDKEGWHGRALKQDELKKALKEIPYSKIQKFSHPTPKKEKSINKKIRIPKSTRYKNNNLIATRESYGETLTNLAKLNENVISIDAEVSNSTFSGKVKESSPKNFIEAYIAEQNMVSMSLGLSLKGLNVFASTFSAFLSRAHDQLRIASISNANFSVCGSHAGISIGQDGASQMGLEDISLFRNLQNSIIFYPSDAVSAGKLVLLSSQLKGIKYLRTTREKTPIIYDNKEKFQIGEFKILKYSKNDEITLIGAGITLHESLKAHEDLKKQGINSAVIDLYCIKPLNITKLIKFIKEHGNSILITEDHYESGGIGEMLSSKLANSGINLKSLSIQKLPHSGKTYELLEKYGISSKNIVNEVKNIIKR